MGRNGAIILFFLGFLFNIFQPSSAFARTYGEGSYGLGVYPGNSSLPSSTPTPTLFPTLTPTTTPTTIPTPTPTPTLACNELPPGSAPTILSIVALTSRSAEIQFSPANPPVTHYALEYGTRRDEYPYGVENLGVNSTSTMSYIITTLKPYTTHYFRIRGVNGCMPGPWSNVKSVKTPRNTTSSATSPFTLLAGSDTTDTRTAQTLPAPESGTEKTRIESKNETSPGFLQLLVDAVANFFKAT